MTLVGRTVVRSVFVAAGPVTVFASHLLVSFFGLWLSVSLLIACVVNKLVEQQKKLEAEEEEAGDAVLVLHSQLAELQSSLATAVSRLARIRKIKKRVKEKGSELFERGMQELDREDGILPALESHENWVVNDLQSLGVPNEVDWQSLGLGEEFNGLGPLLDSGVAGESSSAGAAHG
jgi:hypothetical protein